MSAEPLTIPTPPYACSGGILRDGQGPFAMMTSTARKDSEEKAKELQNAGRSLGIVFEMNAWLENIRDRGDTWSDQQSATYERCQDIIRDMQDKREDVVIVRTGQRVKVPVDQVKDWTV